MSNQEENHPDLELKEVVFHEPKDAKQSPQSKVFNYYSRHGEYSRAGEHSKTPEHPVRHSHHTYHNEKYHFEAHKPHTPKNKWNLGCLYLDKECISYFVQMIVLFAIIATSLYKVATTSDSKELWISLLSSCMGYILPAPSLKKEKN